MVKQRRLEFVEREVLEELWESLPEQARHEVTEHYARLMARALVRRQGTGLVIIRELSELTRHLCFLYSNLIGKYFIGWLLGVPVIVLVIIYFFMN